ncbi:MAG: M23 family metallopeptidase [Alphaproteobacteria bacterium]|nr:M23 family metallopeptidase [Alphaproteobacteria bacterium]
MSLSFKKTALLFLIFCGFLFFLINIIELNSKYKNIKTPNVEKSPKNTLITKDISNKPQIETDDSTENSFKNVKKPKSKETIIIVKKDQTFSSILDNFNVDNKKKFAIINAINTIYDLRELKVSQKIIFLIDKNENVEKIIIELNFNTNLEVDLRSDIKIVKKELETFSEINSQEYVISNSLYTDGINNNIPNQILIKLIQLFSFDLDFQRDIQKDTKVSISYEKIFVKNKSDYALGDIEYAKIIIKNNTLEYFKFLTDEGFIDYFNRQGKNVKKSILKTPIDGARISSSFGMRKHPISGFNKMHKGVDFAAPIGTPVYAGGNGVIEMVGVNGGYGKYIRIRHNNEYKTAYAHLNSYRKGISKGVRVNQGEVIGYVGSTGRSTGPHLHYEIIYQNKKVNPLKLKLPSGKILKGDELARFEKNYKMILANHLNNLFE